MLGLLASRLHDTPEPAKILFVFEVKATPPEPGPLFSLLSSFRRPVDVEFAWGPTQAASAMSETVAKIWAHSSRPDSAPFAH